MAVTAAHSLSLFLSHLEAIWADCKVWRAVVADANPATWAALATAADAITGSTGRTAALDRVYWELYDESPLAPADGSDNYDGNIWPCIQLIEQPLAYNFNGGWVIEGSNITALVEIPVPTAYQGRANWKDAATYHRNFVGRLLREAMELVGETPAGYLDVVNFTLQQIGWVNPASLGGHQIRFATIECSFNGDETP